MTCSRAEQLFSACWEDELSLSERESLEAHFRACRSCREAYDGFARTLEVVAALPRAEAAPGFVESVMARVRESDARSLRETAPWWRGWTWAPSPWKPVLAAAAALTVIVATVSYMGQRSSGRHFGPTAQAPAPVADQRIPSSTNTGPNAMSAPVSVPARTVAPGRDPLARTERATPAANGKVAALSEASVAAAEAPVISNESAGRLTAVPDSLFDHDYDVEFALDPVHLRRGPGGTSLRPARPMPTSEYGRRASITF
jgi:hypothetical protein